MPVPEFNFDERGDNAQLEKDKEKLTPLQKLLAQQEVTPTAELEAAESVGVPLQESGLPTVAQDSGAVGPDYSAVEDIQALMNIKAPTPQMDEARQKRLEAIASAKGVGKALSVLGDVYGLSKGGYVKPSQIQPSEPIIGQIMDESKKYREQMSQAEFAEYLKRLKLGQAMIGAKEREAGRQMSQEQAAAASELAGQKFAYGVAKDEESARLARANLAERARHNKAMEAADKIRAEKAGASTKGMYPIYETGGQKVANVDEGQLDKMFDIIKSKIPIGDDIELLKSQFGEGVTRDHKRAIVSAYVDDERVPEVRIFLGIKEPASSQPAAPFTLPGIAPQNIDEANPAQKEEFKFPGL